jgi:DNA-binding XRE family transcriptional regulator
MTRNSRRRRVEVWMRVKDDGAPLLRARKRAGLTQRELAFLARCSQTTIHLMETGGMTTCSDDLAFRVVARLPVDLEDVFEQRADSPMPVVTSSPRVAGQVA